MIKHPLLFAFVLVVVYSQTAVIWIQDPAIQTGTLLLIQAPLMSFSVVLPREP